ncbi:hypothetical protein [Brevibacillus nitrificans]|nr:hypothetical protein [Brevibacillus nitrificans]MDR7315181.1 hypothetical protein [Brevibacillus nitrificans]
MQSVTDLSQYLSDLQKRARQCCESQIPLHADSLATIPAAYQD